MTKPKLTPDERAGQSYPAAVNLRLTLDQSVFLHMVAEANDEPLSAAARRVIDEAIAVLIERQRTPEGDRTDTFGIVNSFKPDPAWAARHQERT